MSFRRFLAGKQFEWNHSRLALHIVSFANETAFLGHNLLKLTSSEKAHPKGISFSIENPLSVFDWLFILLYSRP